MGSVLDRSKLAGTATSSRELPDSSSLFLFASLVCSVAKLDRSDRVKEVEGGRTFASRAAGVDQCRGSFLGAFE